MAKDTALKIQLGVDADQAKSNLAQFSKSFKDTLTELGASPSDIGFFAQLSKDIASGKVNLEDYDEKTQALLKTFEEGKNAAAAMDYLGLTAHKDVQAQIEKTQAAYDTLAASGTLTGAELEEAAQKTKEKIEALNGSTASWQQSLSDMKGELAIAAGAVYGIYSQFADASKASGEFGKSMAEVSTLLNDTSSLDDLADAVKKVSVEFGGDVNDNAQALYDIVSAGASDAAVAVDQLTASNKLAVGGKTEVSIAADGLTSALNAYGDAAGSATDVSDSFFVAVKAGKTTVEELSSNIGKVAPIANAAGVGLEELLAATATLTSGGVSTSESMTAIKAALTSVIKPSSEAATTAASLGLQFNATALQSQGLAGFLAQVQAKTGGNIETMGKLFGSIEGLNGVLTLTGAGADKFSETLGLMAEKSGQTDIAVGKMMDTPAQQSAKFTAAFNDIKLSIGDAVNAFTPLLTSITNVINVFNNLDSGTKTVIAGLGAAAVAIPPLVLAFSSFIKAFEILKVAIVGTTAATAAHTAGNAAAATATTATTGAITLQTLALKALKIAMAATGIGLLVVGAGALASKFLETSDASEDLTNKLPDAKAAAPLDTLADASDGAAQSLTGAADASKTLTNKLPAKGSDAAVADLAQSALDAKAALNLTTAAAEDLGKQTKTLGLDLAAIDTSFDKTETNALDAFSKIAANSQTSSEVMFQALHAALTEVSSAEGFGLLKKSASDAFSAGKLSGDQFALSLDAITAKSTGVWEEMDKATLSSDTLAEAYKTLGIAGNKELQQKADTAKAAYEQIVAGGASVNDQSAAWKAYAEKAIAANNGVASTVLQSQAAQQGYTISINESGQASIKLREVLEDTAQAAINAANMQRAANTEMMEAAAIAASQAKTAITSIQSTINSAYETMAAAGAYTADAIDGGWKRVTESTNGSAKAAEEYGTAVKTNLFYGVTGGIGGYANYVFEQSKHIVSSYDEQKKAVERYADAIRSGEIDAITAAKSTAVLQAQFSYLGDEDLAPLRAAITDAHNRMLGLQNAATDTLLTIQDEWDQLNNNLDDIEIRRAKKREDEIAAQIKEAEIYGNATAVNDLKKAQELLKQLNAAKIAEAATRSAEATATAAAKTAKIGTAAAQASLGSTGISGSSNHQVTITLGGKNQTIKTATATDASALTSLFAQLNAEMRRS